MSRDMSNFLETLFFICLYLLGTTYFAPRMVRYFLKWKQSKRLSQFHLFLIFAMLSFFTLSTVLIIVLKPIIHSKFPF